MPSTKSKLKTQCAGLRGEAFRFILVGVGATGLHYGIYYALLWLPIPGAWWLNVAYAVGYGVSFLFNFLATCRFTFHAAPSWQRFVGMVGAHGVNLVLHMALFNVFLFLGLAPRLAPFGVFAIAIPVNFLLVRLVFKKL